jgi:hypothetical protein
MADGMTNLLWLVDVLRQHLEEADQLPSSYTDQQWWLTEDWQNKWMS